MDDNAEVDKKSGVVAKIAPNSPLEKDSRLLTAEELFPEEYEGIDLVELREVALDYKGTMSRSFDAITQALLKLGLIRQITPEDLKGLTGYEIAKGTSSSESGYDIKPLYYPQENGEIGKLPERFSQNFIVIPGFMSIMLQWHNSDSEVEAVAIQLDAPMQVDTYFHRITRIDNLGEGKSTLNFLMHDDYYFPNDYQDKHQAVDILPNPYGVFGFPSGIGTNPTREIWEPEKARLEQIIQELQR